MRGTGRIVMTVGNVLKGLVKRGGDGKMVVKPKTTGDGLECERISKFSIPDLLDYVLKHPDYLTDRYYREFHNAIYARYDELSKT